MLSFLPSCSWLAIQSLMTYAFYLSIEKKQKCASHKTACYSSLRGLTFISVCWYFFCIFLISWFSSLIILVFSLQANYLKDPSLAARRVDHDPRLGGPAFRKQNFPVRSWISRNPRQFQVTISILKCNLSIRWFFLQLNLIEYAKSGNLLNYNTVYYHKPILKFLGRFSSS